MPPATEADTKDLFKPEFSIRYTEIVNIKIQQMWIKNIKISNELKCCRFANPDQAYKDFIAAFTKLADPVIKSAGIDIPLSAPLIIGETALATLHDEFNLLIFSNEFLFHNDWLL